MKREKMRGLTRISRQGERTFFFYATIGMAILWGISRIWGG
ncbi:MAG: hypothetical protein R6X27_10790 [Candidatus Desulfacyla sp.]